MCFPGQLGTGNCYSSVLNVSLLNSRIFSWLTLTLLSSNMCFKVQLSTIPWGACCHFLEDINLREKPTSMRRDHEKKTVANGKVGVLICLAYLWDLLLGEKSTEVSFYVNLKNLSHLTELLYWWQSPVLFLIITVSWASGLIMLLFKYNAHY